MKAGYVRMRQPKKVPAIQRTHHSTPRPGRAPLISPYISPYIVKLSSQLKSGTLPVDKKDCHVKEWSYTRVPRQLVPFIESLSLAELVGLLVGYPYLYWHPLVGEQMLYLDRLGHDEQEWQRLGWLRRPSEGLLDPPDEIREVDSWTRSLIAAHAIGVLPGLQIKWELKGGKSGPKAGIANPHPVPRHPEEFIEAERVCFDHYSLQNGFKAQNIDWKRAAKEDIKQAVTEVLNESGLDWSARRETASLDEPISATYHWTLPKLDDAIQKMCANKMDRAGKDGKRAFLAYSVLGDLLDVTPEIVRDTVDNYRRTLPPFMRTRRPKPAV